MWQTFYTEIFGVELAIKVSLDNWIRLMTWMEEKE